MLRIRIRDPVPFLPLDPGWVKKSGSGSGMNNPDHISKNLETILWVKILYLLKIFYVDPDPGSGIFLTLDPGREKIQIRDKHPGSQHCNKVNV